MIVLSMVFPLFLETSDIVAICTVFCARVTAAIEAVVIAVQYDW